MNKIKNSPEFIFESSWEVCNKVGGIYTVLSTRAKTLQDTLEDKVIFIGPDFGKERKIHYSKKTANYLNHGSKPLKKKVCK